MGMSSDGEIFFGVWLGEGNPMIPDYDSEEYEALTEEEIEALEEKYEEFDGEIVDLLVEAEGIYNPWDDRPEGYKYNSSSEFPEFEAKLDKYYEQRRELEDRIPVEMSPVGYHDYPQWVLRLKGTRVYAYGYGAEPLDLDELKARVTPEKIEEAKAFCEAWGLPPFKDPQWWLTSSYG